MSVGRVLAGALLVPLALLASCADEEPEPKMPDPTTASPTTEPTQTETPEPEPETAEEFVRRWQGVSDAMQLSGDTDEFLAMAYKCKACGDFAAAVDDIYSSGGSVESKAATITKLSRQGDDPPTFDLWLKAAKTVVRRGDGTVDRLPGGRQGLRVVLDQVSGAWYVTYYGVL